MFRICSSVCRNYSCIVMLLKIWSITFVKPQWLILTGIANIANLKMGYIHHEPILEKCLKHQRRWWLKDIDSITPKNKEYWFNQNNEKQIYISIESTPLRLPPYRYKRGEGPELFFLRSIVSCFKIFW